MACEGCHFLDEMRRVTFGMLAGVQARTTQCRSYEQVPRSHFLQMHVSSQACQGLEALKGGYRSIRGFESRVANSPQKSEPEQEQEMQ